MMPVYDTAALLADKRFHDCLVFSADELLATHGEIPRAVRYLSDLQKWLLSQAMLALHFEHRLDAARSPISPTNLLRFLDGSPIASRNTALAFLNEIRHYGLLEAFFSNDRRQRLFRALPHTEGLIARWYLTHLRALDQIDGADRAGRFASQPDLIMRAQPKMARALLSSREWCDPPSTIGLFTWAESGSNILHDLASRVPWQLPAERVWIGSRTASAIAERYHISPSHAARILAQARNAGFVGWEAAGNRGDCWVSTTFVRDYRHWQALKFAAISVAFREALEAAPTPVG